MVFGRVVVETRYVELAEVRVCMRAATIKGILTFISDKITNFDELTSKQAI